MSVSIRKRGIAQAGQSVAWVADPDCRGSGSPGRGKHAVPYQLQDRLSTSTLTLSLYR